MLLLSLVLGMAHAQDIRIEQAWARPNPPVVPNGAAYLQIYNDSTTDRHLLSASSQIAKELQLHKTTMENNTTSMRKQSDGIPIAAGSSVVFQPGGLHIMLMGLQQPLQSGQSFELNLEFDQGEIIPVTVNVRKDQLDGSITE